MSRHAWAYVWAILVTGVVLSGLALPGAAQATPQWPTFIALVVLASIAQWFKAEAPTHQLYHPTLVFIFAGVFLLHPFYLVLLVVVPHTIEWAKERLTKSSHLGAWYLQPFNMAVHITAGLAAQWVYVSLNDRGATLITLSSVLLAAGAALIYAVFNHMVIGLALVLARGVSWRESGILDAENLVTDFVLLLMGYSVAVVWAVNPWLSLPALSPLVLIYRALMVPQLKKEAQTDDKTGLWNARHFVKLFTTEMERARRFDRPLAIIMADLDLLRNINNTYGHLAGDTVLAGIGRIIRETIREYDIASRFGGEEFAIVLPEAGPMEAQSVAERLRQAVEAAGFEVRTSPTPIHATVSLGVACFPWDASTSTDLIHQADVAVYQAKLKGRNRLVCASDVPHSVGLEPVPTENRLATPYVAAFVARPEPEDDGTGSNDGAAAARVESNTQTSSTATLKNRPKASVWLLVGAVIAAGSASTLLGLILNPQLDLVAIGMFAVMALITELLQVDLYEIGTVSVSVAILYAAALVTGVPGVAIVSAVIALTHYVRRQPAVYKTVFNWATHILAGWAPMLVFGALAIPLQVSNLLLLTVPALLAALAYYAIDTGLIAAAIALSGGTDFKVTWQEQYRWLADHYLVLCTMGLFLVLAYTALGPLGVVVFALPVLMMRYAQQQYIGRTEDGVRELRRLNQELTRANREILSAGTAIKQLNDQLFLTLAKIVDARDPYVYGHTVKVADYAAAIATELHLPPKRCEYVRQAALLHDIGKIGISEEILHKPHKLTAEEHKYLQTHASLGAELLETSQGLRHLAPFVRHHHERWDGTGYPDGLRREESPLEARILAVSDSVEAMASDRPYHKAMPLSDVIAELRRSAGTQFDPTVVEAFIRIAEREGNEVIANSAREVARKYVGNEYVPASDGRPHFQPREDRAYAAF
jgi:diguanylate cyclase (GGDEF)-like protein/putative nucleotidyltransferase with HDIG domain